MITMLDCITRVPSIIEDILKNHEVYLQPMIDYLGDNVNNIEELVFVGSGTSNTCAQTSREVVERVSGLNVSAYVPNVFLAKTVYNPKALYVFTSQSGTSSLTKKAQLKMKELGNLTVSITESETTPLAKESGAHVYMGCGVEEYGQRTIGYCSSILTQIMIGMKIGLLKNNLSKEQYEEYFQMISKIPDSHRMISKKTMEWFDANKEQLIDVDSYIFYGAGPLWGVAQEGALKTLETAKRFLCIGYEMDDGMHGPTMGFHKRIGVIILNDNRNVEIANGLAKYVKNEVGYAYVIGQNAIDEHDLAFDPMGGIFNCLEYAPVVEIIAYRLAIDTGITLKPFNMITPMPESKYFSTHDMK